MSSNRTKLVHVCSECGTSHPKWAGRCVGCGDWNTLVEDVEVTGATNAPVASSSRPGPTRIGDVGTEHGDPVTTAIAEREPQDSITEISSDLTRIFYFTEIREMAGETVIHRWEFGGEVLAEVPFEVGGPRWRAYSSKRQLSEAFLCSRMCPCQAMLWSARLQCLVAVAMQPVTQYMPKRSTSRS